MLCEKCKIREASIQYTNLIGGTPEVHYMCLQCASEMVIDSNTGGKMEGEFPLAKFLSGLLSLRTDNSSDDQVVNIECPNCHTTYKEFIDNSRFGCKDCYEVFDLLIGNRIKQLQGSDTHKGKHPKYTSMRIPDAVQRELNNKPENSIEFDANMEKLVTLKKSLKEAIDKEDFEEAAKIRDEIRSIENREAKG